MGSDPRRIAVLMSGRGSNLRALIEAIRDGRLDAQIGVVISNRPDAAGLERARTAGIPAVALDHRAFSTRERFEGALVEELRVHEVALICLAGFMRLLDRRFWTRSPIASSTSIPRCSRRFQASTGGGRDRASRDG